MCVRLLTRQLAVNSGGCSEPLVGAHHVVAVGADMVDILQSIDAEGDQTATPGVREGGGVGGAVGRGSISTIIILSS